MPHLDESSRYPSTWAQVYALHCGELTALIESVLDDGLPVDELRQLWQRYAMQHYERVQRLAKDAATAEYDRLRARQGVRKP